MNSKNYGGKRSGAGRPKSGRNNLVCVGKTANDLLAYHANCVNLSKNQLADALIFSELASINDDFVYCECGAPVLYTPLITISGVIICNCKGCGKEWTHEID